MVQMRAATERGSAHIQDIERDYYSTERVIEDLTTVWAEVREYQERHAALEERVWNAERQLAQLQGASTSTQAPPETTRRK